ncbi:MAG: hypothetical protein MI741_15890 [Rhodospirillales bacterium]|nr:hypothetical protein [Rhodospirillales bacterium]
MACQIPDSESDPDAIPVHRPDPLPSDKLTWAVLLGRWIAFARSALALPQAGEAGPIRASVPDLIMLQAVWFALQHLDELPSDEQALGLDRAALLIDKHIAAIQNRWPDTMPPEISELIHDTRQQLENVRQNLR